MTAMTEEEIREKIRGYQETLAEKSEEVRQSDSTNKDAILAALEQKTEEMIQPLQEQLAALNPSATVQTGAAAAVASAPAATQTGAGNRAAPPAPALTRPAAMQRWTQEEWLAEHKREVEAAYNDNFQKSSAEILRAAEAVNTEFLVGAQLYAQPAIRDNVHAALLDKVRANRTNMTALLAQRDQDAAEEREATQKSKSKVDEQMSRMSVGEHARELWNMNAPDEFAIGGPGGRAGGHLYYMTKGALTKTWDWISGTTSNMWHNKGGTGKHGQTLLKWGGAALGSMLVIWPLLNKFWASSGLDKIPVLGKLAKIAIGIGLFIQAAGVIQKFQPETGGDMLAQTSRRGLNPYDDPLSYAGPGAVSGNLQSAVTHGHDDGSLPETRFPNPLINSALHAMRDEFPYAAAGQGGNPGLADPGLVASPYGWQGRNGMAPRDLHSPNAEGISAEYTGHARGTRARRAGPLSMPPAPVYGGFEYAPA